MTLPLKIKDLVEQINYTTAGICETNILIRSQAVSELSQSKIQYVSYLENLSYCSSSLLERFIKFQGSLDCVGDLRHIILQNDCEGVLPNSKKRNWNERGIISLSGVRTQVQNDNAGNMG